MTAAQRINELMQQNLGQLDPWIENELTQKFLKSGSKTVTVDYRDFDDIDLDQKSIILKLQLEGFIVTYECEDRPCASPYFKITIPSTI